MSTREIQLSNGGAAIVDADLYHFLMRWTWQRSEKGYAKRGITRDREHQCAIYMHQVIAYALHGILSQQFQVDHADGNPLNNTSSNLRVATPSENSHHKRTPKSSQRFRGVSKKKNEHRWRAAIGHRGKTIWIGQFGTEEEAALAYDAKARELFGEFATVNFPLGPTT